MGLQLDRRFSDTAQIFYGRSPRSQLLHPTRLLSSAKPEPYMSFGVVEDSAGGRGRSKQASFDKPFTSSVLECADCGCKTFQNQGGFKRLKISKERTSQQLSEEEQEELTEFDKEDVQVSPIWKLWKL